MKLEMKESMPTTPGLFGSEADSGLSGAKYLPNPSRLSLLMMGLLYKANLSTASVDRPASEAAALLCGRASALESLAGQLC